jgi:hypothetical protein
MATIAAAMDIMAVARSTDARDPGRGWVHVMRFVAWMKVCISPEVPEAQAASSAKVGRIAAGLYLTAAVAAAAALLIAWWQSICHHAIR